MRMVKLVEHRGSCPSNRDRLLHLDVHSKSLILRLEERKVSFMCILSINNEKHTNCKFEIPILIKFSL